MKLIFSPAALREQRKAATWYRKKSQSLAIRFRDEVERTLQRISSAPQQFPIGYDDRQTALVDVFPYIVIFETTEDFIWIISIMHGSRRPAYWRRRSMPKPPPSDVL
jgi:toxin ParE1/3/4